MARTPIAKPTTAAPTISWLRCSSTWRRQPGCGGCQGRAAAPGWGWRSFSPSFDDARLDVLCQVPRFAFEHGLGQLGLFDRLLGDRRGAGLDRAVGDVTGGGGDQEEDGGLDQEAGPGLAVEDLFVEQPR